MACAVSPGLIMAGLASTISTSVSFDTLQSPIWGRKSLSDIWNKCLVVLVGLFFVCAAFEEGFLVIGFVLGVYLRF